MTRKQLQNNLQFIASGGEMGELMRSKDWSKTIIGNPETWPQSLRTTLGIVLNSKFPMFLWWGKDLICFYNDAYRPSLGQNGKHPSILGMKAEEAWPEIWDIIKPLIDQVLSGGEGTWSEDQLIPIYRNGKIEDVYWTFSYSPVYDESGKIAGVLVTCNETTEKVKTFKNIGESEERFRNMAESSEILIALGDETSDAIYFNKAWERFTGRPMQELLRYGWVDLLHPDDRQPFLETLRLSFEKKESFSGEFRMLAHGEYRNLLVKSSARFNSDGSFAGYISSCADITESVISQNKIKENEERLNVVIEASGLATWELNVQTKEIHYSERYSEMFGFDKDTELVHAELLKMLHPDDVNLREKAFMEAYKTGFLHFEFRIIHKNGSIHWIQARGKLFYDAENKPLKLIGISRDITIEKSHEIELMESEQKFRLLADSMPQHIWTADTQGNLNYYNKSVFNYSGLTPEIIDKVGWLDIVHPDDREENIKQWTKAIQSGEDFLFEHRFRRFDGEYRWQLSRAIPQKTTDGKIQMWVGTSTDIQDQKMFTTELERQVRERTKELKELNESLAKSEQRYHLMVEEVQDYAILYLNKQGNVENWNQGAEKIKGYRADEIIGKSFSQFYTDHDRRDHLPQLLLSKATKTGRAVQEGWRVRKDGTLFWASVVITAVHNKADEVIGFSKVTHDLTEKKAAEDALKNNAAQLEIKNAELQKMNKELESFAYISSHDLQEPLRKIQTFASRIAEKEYETLSENARDNFQRMQNAAKRMQILIEDLLAYSRTSNVEKKYVKSDLRKIVEEVKEDLSEELEQKKAIIEMGEMCETKIIPFQFRQLMQNLITNSIKFAVEGRPPHIKIFSEIRPAGTFYNDKLVEGMMYCHIRVCDNGIGFDPQYSQKIFEVFQRLHGKAEYVGTGIGLAIVKKIVDNHDGIITATGELNKGAIFDIYFPVKK